MIEADGLPVPRRYWSVIAIWLAITMAVLDSAIANVALPTIARDLNASPASSIWIVNAYQVAITISLLPLAALGDIVGYRRIYQAGLAVFTLASLSCALAHSLSALTLARVAQGLGAAGIMSMNGALVRFTYPHRMLGRGIGMNAVVVAVASAVGPTVASGILAVGAWQWLFAINLPIGIVTLVIASKALPHTPLSGRGFDWIGAILNAVCLGPLLLGVEGLTRGESASLAVFELAIGGLAGVFLVRRSLGQARPLVPVDLLRIPIFALSVATSIASFAAQMAAFVALPFIFQYGLGRSAVETGLLMTPWPIAVGAAAPFAGRLADRYPAAILGGAGLAVMCVGLLLLASAPAHPSAFDIGWRMALCGLGFGFFQSPNNRTMISSAPKSRSGGAGGMLATARLLGQTAGAMVVALIFRTGANSHSGSGPLIVAAVFSGVAAVVSFSRLTAKAAVHEDAPPAAAVSTPEAPAAE